MALRSQERRKSGLPEVMRCAIFVVRSSEREILETIAAEAEDEQSVRKG